MLSSPDIACWVHVVWYRKDLDVHALSSGYSSGVSGVCATCRPSWCSCSCCNWLCVWASINSVGVLCWPSCSSRSFEVYTGKQSAVYRISELEGQFWPALAV